jgi:cyclohexadienyl dehydratase
VSPGRPSYDSEGQTLRALPTSLVLLAGIGLAGVLVCAQPRPEPHGASAPAAAAVLRVGTSGDYPPFSVLSADAGYAGFDVALVERLAGDLGLTVEWVPFRWPELESRLAAGDFDLVASGVTWRPGRAVHGHMTRATAAGGPCLVGATGLLDGSRPRVGARVGVNRGGVLERYARERLAGAQIVTVDRNLELGGLLASGAVDAVVTDSFERAHLCAEELSAVFESVVYI